MPPLRRGWIVLFGLLLVVAAGYSFAARQEVVRTPVQELEGVVGRYTLRYDAETSIRTNFSDFEQFHIYVRPQRGEITYRSDGRGISGTTEWGVSISGWNADLQQALLRALNDSPATVRQLVEHRDERIQFLLLKVLRDWGLGGKSLTDLNDPSRGKPWNLQPHAVEALLKLAGREDPHTVGTVIMALNFKRKFSSEVFRAAMAHDSSNIRAEALRWLSPERQQLTSAEIQAVLPVLVEHLTDRDIVVREWSLTGLQSLVAYWEQSLGGAPYELVRTDQSQMIKLPAAPASNDWHGVVSREASELVENYQGRWEAWLETATPSP